MAKSCFIQYALLGWSGYFPPVCRHTDLLIPASYGKYLWGWPAVDLRAEGIGLFTGDIAAASQAASAARPAASAVVGSRWLVAAWRGQAY